MPAVSAYFDQAILFRLNQRLRAMGLPGPSFENRLEALIASERFYREKALKDQDPQPIPDEVRAFANSYAAHLTQEDALWAPIVGLEAKTYTEEDVLLMLSCGWLHKFVNTDVSPMTLV